MICPACACQAMVFSSLLIRALLACGTQCYHVLSGSNADAESC